MSAYFTEDRGFPGKLRNGGMGHYRYGDATFTEAGGAAIMNAISPFEFLKGLFVDKPRQEREAQVALAQSQAQLLGQQADARGKTTRTMVLVGSGLAGLMLIALVLRKKRSSLAGYRRKSRRSRRSR